MNLQQQEHALRLDFNIGLIKEFHNDPLIVICNGPSLKDFDFDSIKKYPCIGMNAAYRMFEKMNFWPTYFCCADLRVGMFHTDEYERILQERDSTFFLRQNAVEKINLNKDVNRNKVFTLNCSQTPSLEFDLKKRSVSVFEPNSTGYISCILGMALHFKNIILLGADCNYIELIDGAERTESGAGHGGARLTLTKTPSSNPNYWFDDYQQKGDEYHVPNGSTVHMQGWKKLADLATNTNTNIINCSVESKIPFFRKLPFKSLNL